MRAYLSVQKKLLVQSPSKSKQGEEGGGQDKYST